MQRPDPRLSLRHKHLRLLIVGLSLFVLFNLLIIQFFKLQIIEGNYWKKCAKSQHESILIEPAKRGIFYSNTQLQKNGTNEEVAFVMDVPKYHLLCDSVAIPLSLKESVAEKLSSLLPQGKLDSKKALDDIQKKSRSRKLASWIAKDEKKLIDEWWGSFAKQNKIPKNAIFFEKDYQRSYPFGHLLGQVLHTVREDKDKVTHAAFPTGGLELYFQDVLEGRPGKRIIQRSLKHQLDTDHVVSEPIDGANIYLTINHHIQAIAEEELEKGIKAVGAKGGYAVMMDPSTGEIYALAQFPFFEPMNYRYYYNQPDKLEDTKIKPISDNFEPGSTIKAFTTTIGLLVNQKLKERGQPPLFDPEEMVPTLDGSFPGRTPLKDTSPHHYLNMNLAVQKSSNIYMARLVDKIIKTMGAKWYREQLVEIFGFGVPTKIELPYENPGMLPKIGAKYPSGQLQWTVPTPYSLSIGYNLMVNSIQLLRAHAIFANGGYMVQPHLVKKILSYDKKQVIYQRKIQKKRVLPEEITSRVVEAMKYVTKPGGGAPLADVFGYTEAGKTGTAEKIVNGVYSKKLNFSTFIGFTPVTNPRFLLIVCVDEPQVKVIQGFGQTQFGGKCAGPIFREIARKTLQYLGVPYDDPYGFPAGDPRSDREKADWFVETRELTKRYNEWNNKS